MKKSVHVLMIVIWLAAACGTGDVPRQTPTPATSPSPSSTALPSATPRPPTATPTLAQPSPTATAAPPATTLEPSTGTVVLIFGDRFINELYATVRTTLEEAGYQVHVASTELSPIRPKEGGAPVQPDLSLENLGVHEYDAILFTCDNDLAFGNGRPETDRIAQNAVAHNKVLGAICNAPLELGFAGVLEGKIATGEPSQTCRRLESEFGATCTGAPVERDGLIVTARDRYASRAFAETIIEVLQEQVAVPSASDASGGLIAFVSTRDGNGEIYVMNADGSDQRRLTNWRQWDGFPDWSPDGEQIVYYSYLSNRNWVIKVMDADGSNPRQLTDSGVCDGAPHWSPDGTRITYDSGDCTGDNREIYVVDSDGSDPSNLTNNKVDDMLAAWSPDSTQLVFSSNRDGNYEIYVMDADGNNVRRLTENSADDHAPAWSPDGTQIAFYSERDGNAEIYVMDADDDEQGSRDVRNLTNNPTEDWFPRWSPDGSQITFSSKRNGNLDIYVMNADGSNVRRLTNSSQEDFNSVWQPLPTRIEAEPTPTSGQPPPETRTRFVDSMTMVHVPGGAFLMGSTDAQIDVARALCDEYPDDYGKCKQSPFDDESPQHTVTIDDFWLDRTEVTNAQYALCVEGGACRESRLANDPSYNGGDYPVAGIPWPDAADYCVWAGGRLPTEAEWEYAARGTEGAVFPWGDEFDCAGGNFWDTGTGCNDGYPEPAPVGSFPEGSSWCGALDMGGNVWEWVADAYGPYSAEAQVNPTGPASGSERILRGGSWGYLPAFSRTAYRYPVPSTADYLAVGFRCAASAGDTPVIAGPVVAVPSGSPPVLDGVLEPDEWASALQDKLSDGSELFLMHDGDYLYVGIRASAKGSGVGSICIDRGDQVAILHSSAALGTAIYEKDGAEWQQVQEFSWRCRDTGSSATAQKERSEFLQVEGWLANNGLMGVPEEVEYQIAMPEGALRLAVTFLGPPNFDSVAAWPQGLGDDCQNIKLITGPIPERLRFSPQTWVTVSSAGRP